MEFQLPISLGALPQPIKYGDRILLTGSCFTEHIGDALHDWKFNILQNPNGILFDVASVASSLISYIEPQIYTADDLIFLNELWQSWQHHSIFSGTDPGAVLRGINASQQRAHAFLKDADWLIITLGSAFSYRLSPDADSAFRHGVGGTAAVANCHRAPGKTFARHLMTIEEIQTALDGCLYRMRYFNPKLKIIFTVSPVRHIRDGVVENNRSKARLLESVHHLVGKFDRLYYFPAYELVIDVLRDYRFYDIDMVHPNYPATQYVLEKFTEYGIEAAARPLMEELRKLVTARRHRPLHPDTGAHARFRREQYEKAADLARRFPFLDLAQELAFFSEA
ncbi:MAG TPA: GSCFA domain-containing protein [Puia sp.]|nr:GSCFA domain-containing protein [Puia sp.]